MQTFCQWLENFEFSRSIPPPDYSKKIWVNDPKNPEQIASWQKERTAKIFKMPLKNDKFIHFTENKNEPFILKSQQLNGSSVFAISTTFGKWYPEVQFTHIKKRIDEVTAIIFQTNKMPVSARAEEVVWHDDVPILNARVIPTRLAINILKKTPHRHEMNHYMNEVEYF